MLLILLKSSACLAVFILFYKLCLEKTSAHNLKRFYLIGAVLVSICIPFITFIEYIEVQPEILTTNLVLNNTEHFQPIESTSLKDYIPIIIWSIYILGVSIFAFRFFKNLNNLFQKIKRNPKFKNENTFHVLLQELITPHTFLNYIFLNKNKYENNQIPQEVILHEQTHANQKHALDVIFIEILQILFWFNPLLYFIKKDIKLNHEFLADQAVLNKGIASSTYQNILLAFSSNAPYTPLANAINYSLIKKRFTVMKTKTSKPVLWLRSLIILPLLAILIYSFSERLEVEKEVASFESLTIQETDKGATEAMMKEYIEFINEVEKSNTIWSPKLNRAKAIYDIMTEAQRATVKKYPKTPPINLATVKPKTPTTTEFNSWKNGDKFAIWIDGKNVPNETLNNYSSTDITYYFVSKVYKNAQTKKHPQPFQNNLYTKKGFEESYLKRNVNNYNSLKNEYIKAINEESINPDEEKILKAQLSRTYEKLSDEEKNSVEKLNEEVILKNVLKRSVNVISKKLAYQQKATPKQLLEYNKLVNLFNLKNEGERIIKVKDVERIQYIYNLMTSEQKIGNSKFPDFSTVAPPPKPYQQKKHKPIIILINKKGQLLVNDNVCKIENLKSHLKKISTKKSRISSVDITTDFDTPNGVITKVKNTLRELGILKVNIKQLTHNNYTYQKATPEQLAEYNKLAKKYNVQPENKRVIKLKDINHLEYLYGLMTKEQKATAEPFPNCPPPPPPPATKVIKVVEVSVAPPPPPVPGNATPEQKAKYKKIIDAYKKKHPEVITKGKPESGEVIEAPMNMIPPPPPKTPLDQVIDMAKKGATFYYNDKEITLKKAKEIVLKKKDKHLGISTYNIKGKYSLKIWDYDPDKLPKPKSSMEYVTEMSKTDAIFYYDNNKITSEKAVNLIKKNKDLNISTRNKNGINVVKIQTEPITISH